MSVGVQGPAAGAMPAAALPAGVRDALPVEAEELRQIERALRGRFAAYGYREVRTPVLELAEVIDRAQEGGLGAAYRLFDDHGRVLVLRPDLTIPVARLVATRMGDHPGPVRVAYEARAFRPPPPGAARAAEDRQAGVELVGEPGPAADAEVIALLVDALRASGARGVRIGLADVSLTAAVLDGLGIGADERAGFGAALRARDQVAWRRRAERVAPGNSLLSGLPAMRGGPEVLARVAAGVPAAEAACARLSRVLELVAAHGAGDAVMLDLGVLRDWPYYSGVVFEAYAPDVGAPVAMGGRYDGLGARFGRARPAVGFGVALDLLHRAIARQGARDAPPRAGVVVVDGLDRRLDAAVELRRAGVSTIAVGPDEDAALALAAADGWRYVAAPAGDGFTVLDRASGERRTCARIAEVVPSPA